MNLYEAVKAIDVACFQPIPEEDRSHYPAAIHRGALPPGAYEVETVHELVPIDLGPPRGKGPHPVALLEVEETSGEIVRFGTVPEGWHGDEPSITWHPDLEGVIAWGAAALKANEALVKD